MADYYRSFNDKNKRPYIDPNTGRLMVSKGTGYKESGPEVPAVVQGTGNDTRSVMSQAAVTRELGNAEKEGNEKGAVLAHSECTLEERIAALEELLLHVLSGKVLIPELQVKKLGVWDDNNLIVTGAGAPTKAPDRAGQFYINTDSGAVYKSTGNDAVADWKNM